MHTHAALQLSGLTLISFGHRLDSCCLLRIEQPTHLARHVILAAGPQADGRVQLPVPPQSGDDVPAFTQTETEAMAAKERILKLQDRVRDNTGAVFAPIDGYDIGNVVPQDSQLNGISPIDELLAVEGQDADVVLVGEMRDLETIAMAVTAAEMGLLVFGTLHTNGAGKTIDRIIDAFPSDEQEQVRISLSESLTAVVSQLLLPTADGKGRVAVHEILLRTTGLSNLIREGNTVQIQSLIQSGKSQGMQLMDDALFALVKEHKILPLDAYRKALDKSRFEPMLGDAATTAA